MATNKTANKEIENEVINNEQGINKDKKIENLEKQIENLKNMFESVMTNQNNVTNMTVSSPVLKMDKPCTLIHLIECSIDLPTTITVNGDIKYFTKFGEKRTFRLTDMENIISKYGSYFQRGVFTLGDDCEEYKGELGINCVPNDIPVNTYRKLEQLPNKEFEKLIKDINETQRVHIVQTWVQRYFDKKPGYNDIEKIRILNRYTRDKELFKKGMLSDLLEEVE